MLNKEKIKGIIIGAVGAVLVFSATAFAQNAQKAATAVYEDRIAANVDYAICFHGGGDSAKHIAKVSEWYRVAKDHNFLLICVENHLNSTATEMIELIDILTGVELAQPPVND